MLESIICGVSSCLSWYTYFLFAAFLYTVVYIFEVELGNRRGRRKLSTKMVPGDYEGFYTTTHFLSSPSVTC